MKEKGGEASYTTFMSICSGTIGSIAGVMAFRAHFRIIVGTRGASFVHDYEAVIG